MKKHINFIALLLFFNLSLGWSQNNHQDINKALDVCASSTIIEVPIGNGKIDDLKEDLAKGCFLGSAGTLGEGNSLWLKVTISKSGQFGFNIKSSGSKDYDFIVYKNVANVNKDLNQSPIRCSRNDDSGVGITGVGNPTQDNYEDWISASNGDIYYILVTSQIEVPVENIEFELTGTAEYNCSNTQAPILSTWTSQTICGKNSITLDASPTNLSPSVQIYYEWEKNGVSLNHHDAILNVTEAGTYSVSVTANLFPPVKQSVVITKGSDPPPTLDYDGQGPIVNFCGSSLPTLKVKSNASNVKWFYKFRNKIYDLNVTGTQYTPPNPQLVYIAIAYSPDLCSSKSLEFQLKKYPNADLVINPTSYATCGGKNPTLTASTNTGKTIEWYDLDHNLLHIGTTWTNVPIGDYYAIAKGSPGSTCDSKAINVYVVKDVTPDLSSNKIEYCKGGTLPLYVNFSNPSAEAGATVKWYNQKTGGKLMGTGNPFTIKSPSGTSGTAWAEVTSTAYCTQPSERVAVQYDVIGTIPTITLNDTNYGFCGNQSPEIISVTTSALDDNVLWFEDDNNTPVPLTDSSGNQIKGKSIKVYSPGVYWVKATDTGGGCESKFIKINVKDFGNLDLKDVPNTIYSCGNFPIKKPILLPEDSKIDMNDPKNYVEWYSQANANPSSIISTNEIPANFIGKTVYARLIVETSSNLCESAIYPIDIVYQDIPVINPTTTINQFFCEEITPNPLGAKTNDDTYEIIWYNNNNIERGRTKNGQTINPHPDDYTLNDVTIYYAQAMNPLSGCTSEKLKFTLTKIKPPVLSSKTTELNYCRDSEYEELNITISNGDPQFIKWFNSTDTEVGTGSKLVIIDAKNGVDLGEGEFYATASSDGKNCASNVVSILVNKLDISTTTITTPLTVLFEGDTLELSTTNPTDIETYLWTGPNGFSSDLPNPIIENITLDHTGQYNVFMSNKCESRNNSIDILVLENVESALGENIVFCKNDTNSITTVTKDLSTKYPQDYTFQWYGPNGFSSNEKIITINKIGRYVLTVTSPEGHSSTGSLAVLFSTLDLKDENIKTCYKQTLLQPIGGTQPYQYALDNGSWQSSPIFTNIEQGFHTYKVQDANGCTIETSGEYYTPFILRKAFTPNGDGYNDTWDLSALQGCTNLDVKIFDRYGRYLYQIKTNNLKWDGNVNGKPLPNGTYWYAMEFNDGITPVLKGSITIRRTKD